MPRDYLSILLGNGFSGLPDVMSPRTMQGTPQFGGDTGYLDPNPYQEMGPWPGRVPGFSNVMGFPSSYSGWNQMAEGLNNLLSNPGFLDPAWRGNVAPTALLGSPFHINAGYPFNPDVPLDTSMID